MTLGLGGTPECLRAPTPSLLFNSLCGGDQGSGGGGDSEDDIDDVEDVGDVDDDEDDDHDDVSPPMALWQQRRAAAKVL